MFGLIISPDAVTKGTNLIGPVSVLPTPASTLTFLPATLPSATVLERAIPGTGFPSAS